LDAKGDSDEAPRELRSASPGKAGDRCLDHPIPEVGASQDCHRLDIAIRLIRLNEPDSAATTVRNVLRIDVPKLEVPG
jgi:hypothetical protein